MIRQFATLDLHKGRIKHGVTTVKWGSFKEDSPTFEKNLSALQKACHLERPVLINQVHGDKVLEFREPSTDFPDGDALITNEPDLPLMVKVADCQGVMMYDPTTHSIGVVHSGWRGSTLNIIGKTVERMKDRFGTNPHDLVVAVSPSLGPCCAEFSDPFQELPEFCHRFIVEKNHVDFWSLTLWQCLIAGIPGQQVELTEECTQCHADYYSHRNGDSERMGVFLTLN